MLTPLVILAILSVVGGWVGIPQALAGSNHFEHFLDPVFAVQTHAENATNADQVSHGLERGLAVLSVLVALLGWFVADLFYRQRPGTLGARAAGTPLYRLVAHKYYIDELYNALIILPGAAFTRLILGSLIESGVVNGSGRLAAFATQAASSGTRRIQSGNIRSYAGWLAAGAAVVILVMTYTVLTAHAVTR